MPQHPDIYLLVSKYLAGQADEEESYYLEAWKRDHPEEFETLRNIWLTTISDTQAFHSERAKQRLNQRIDAFEAEHAQRSEPPSYFFLKIAASICILMLFATGVYFLKPWEVLQDAGETWVEKGTARSQMAGFVLPDGSKVKLNADSKIRYSSRFGQDEFREIFLDGEAFFEVTHDPEHPFVVHSGRLSTRVLGTSFAVDAYPEDETTKVTVATGKVEVLFNDDPISQVLLPEKQLISHKNKGEWEILTVALDSELSWTAGKLVFENTPLPQLARILERHYDVKIVLESEKLKHCHCTAAFDGESLFHVLDAIGYINDIAYTFDQGVVTLTGNGCQP